VLPLLPPLLLLLELVLDPPLLELELALDEEETCPPLELLLVVPLPELLPPGLLTPLLLLPPGLLTPLLLPPPFEPPPPDEVLVPDPESSPCGKVSDDGVGLFPVPP
jgi:hypothetical protein